MLLHGRPRPHREDGFGGWQAVALCTVWPLRVVVLSPLLGQHLRFSQCVEELAVEQLIAKPGVEALAVAATARPCAFSDASVRWDMLQQWATRRKEGQTAKAGRKFQRAKGARSIGMYEIGHHRITKCFSDLRGALTYTDWTNNNPIWIGNDPNNNPLAWDASGLMDTIFV